MKGSQHDSGSYTPQPVNSETYRLVHQLAAKKGCSVEQARMDLMAALHGRSYSQLERYGLKITADEMATGLTRLGRTDPDAKFNVRREILTRQIECL